MTYEPIPYATPVGPPPIENSRRGGLIAFGIVSILIGSVAGCLSAVTLLAVVMMGSLPGGAQAAMFPSELAVGVLMFRLRVIGWWLAFVVIALGFTSAIMTFAKLGMLEFYRRGHASASDLQQLMNSSAMMGIAPIVITGVFGIVCLAYLMWVHRFFRRAGKAGAQ